MADFDAAAKAATALRLIKKFGGPVTVRTFSNPTVDQAGATPWKPSAPTPTETSQSDISAVFLPLEQNPSSSKPPKTYADGSVQQIGDMYVLMGTDGSPALGSILVRADGTQWSVKQINTLAPNGTPIVHELWVRQ